jgi:Zn-dependent M16 (insulinase) family peptidase
VLDTETELALGFLDNLLLGTPAAPLRKVLMESGLGEAIIGGGMDDDLRQPAFSIGLKVRPRHHPSNLPGVGNEEPFIEVQMSSGNFQ